MTLRSDPHADLRDALIREARATGFADVGFTTPWAVAGAGLRLRDWVAAGNHASMDWIADRIAWRADPSGLWPAARSVVMLAWNYAPPDDPLAPLARPERGTVSVYARDRDYHDRIKKALKRLGRWLIERAGGEIKVFVDTAPVMEKPLAQAAGLGWQGKHSNLVSRGLGSWFFLGAIFTTLELAPDQPHADRCGSCRRCLDICPTAAFPAPYVLDAGRCISYLTIEHRGAIPRGLRPAMGNRIFGCDDCLAVCPWNRFARAAQGAEPPEPPLLAELAALDEAGFRARFAGSPIKRTGRARLLRNVAVAVGNSGEPGLLPAARRLAADAEPVVAAHGLWALGRLAPAEARANARPDHPDPLVAEESRALLAAPA